jgi:hypothetical protein
MPQTKEHIFSKTRCSKHCSFLKQRRPSGW